MRTRIGLQADNAKELSGLLNDLLANLQIFYMNVRGFHWNIKGDKFFELHLKFEELYNDVLLKIDEVAERVLTLGSTPYHSFSNYITYSDIKEIGNVNEGNECLASIVDSFEILLKKERILLEKAGSYSDEGTSSLMSDYIREQEKLVWMYSAYLS